MIRLEYGLERNKVVYFSLWVDVGVFQGELKIKGPANWKSAVTVESLI